MAVRGTDEVYNYYSDEELENYNKEGSAEEYYTVAVRFADATDPVEHWERVVAALNAAGFDWKDA